MADAHGALAGARRRALPLRRHARADRRWRRSTTTTSRSRCAGRCSIERDLGEGVERGSFRHGSSLIMAAGQDEPLALGPADDRAAALPAARASWRRRRRRPASASPQLIDRFAFEDPDPAAGGAGPARRAAATPPRAPRCSATWRRSSSRCTCCAATAPPRPRSRAARARGLAPAPAAARGRARRRAPGRRPGARRPRGRGAASAASTSPAPSGAARAPRRTAGSWPAAGARPRPAGDERPADRRGRRSASASAARATSARRSARATGATPDGVPPRASRRLEAHAPDSAQHDAESAATRPARQWSDRSESATQVSGRVDREVWGDEPYYGLDREFDPELVPDRRAARPQEELIARCREVLRPVAIECDRTNRYPRENLEAHRRDGPAGHRRAEEVGRPRREPRRHADGHGDHRALRLPVHGADLHDAHGRRGRPGLPGARQPGDPAPAVAASTPTA